MTNEMTNDEGMTQRFPSRFRPLSIWVCFVIRHSCFVIVVSSLSQWKHVLFLDKLVTRSRIHRSLLLVWMPS